MIGKASISKFFHVVLKSFMITTGVHLSHFEKILFTETEAC